MSRKELREFIAAAEAEQREPTSNPFEKLTVAPTLETKTERKMVKQVLMKTQELPKVMKQVDESDISKMTKDMLQKVAEEVIENKLENIEEMTKQE